MPSDGEFLIAGDAMFGLRPMELLIAAIVALLLFGKRLPTVAQRHRMSLPDRRTDEFEGVVLKAMVLGLVVCLWYVVLNSR